MKVTETKIIKNDTVDSRILAFANVVLDNELQLTGLSIRQGVTGVYVTYPNIPDIEDTQQIFYPISANLRNDIESSIMNEYQIHISKS